MTYINNNVDQSLIMLFWVCTRSVYVYKTSIMLSLCWDDTAMVHVYTTR